MAAAIMIVQNVAIASQKLEGVLNKLERQPGNFRYRKGRDEAVRPFGESAKSIEDDERLFLDGSFAAGLLILNGSLPAEEPLSRLSSVISDTITMTRMASGSG